MHLATPRPPHPSPTLTSPTTGNLLVSSDHGTVHIFRLALGEAGVDASPDGGAAAAAAGADGAGNARSSLSFLGNILPKALTPTYIQSQWSFAQFRLPGSEKQLTRSIAAFGANDKSTFLVVCADGTFFKCRFDPAAGGECHREDWQRYLLGEDED